MNDELYPLLFEPVYKDYIWGGHRIPEIYERETDEEICAESWEISDRKEGMSIVRNGPLAGKTLHELVKSLGPALVGQGRKDQTFPLLIKIIDAKERLSVQVHPNDENAGICDGEAKTEMWYVLDSKPGSKVFSGLKRGTTAGKFKDAIINQELENILCTIPATIGSVIYIPGGRVHAIAEGCLLLEVQQNSNTTYRVYDWGRMGHDGKPRELHIEQAMKVINWNDEPLELATPVRIADRDPSNLTEILSTPYFLIGKLEVTEKTLRVNDGKSFHILFIESGHLRIESGDTVEEVGPGTSCLIPAGIAEYYLSPSEDRSSIIIISLC